MRRLALVLLILFVAGCATLRTSEPIPPGVHLHSADEVGLTPTHSAGKTEQPVLPEAATERVPAITTEPTRTTDSQEIALAPQTSVPALQRTPEKPSTQSQIGPVPDHKLHGLVKLAEINDQRIVNVFVGMYRKNVEDIMGRAQNPYKRLTLTVENQVYEVLYYLTREPRKGRPITDRMLTPVIFKKNQVVAIGAYKLKKLIRTGTLGRQKNAGTVANPNPGPSS